MTDQHRLTRYATLNDIGLIINQSLSLEEILTSVIDVVNRYLGYQHIAILLVDPDEPDSLVLRARHGVYATETPRPYRQKIGQGIIGEAALTRKPVWIADVRQDRRYIPVPGGEEIVAELATPLVRGNQLLGVFNIESYRPFPEEDVADIQLVASQLSTAIDHAILFANAQRRLSETRLLYETSQRISMALDVTSVVRAYLEQVATGGRHACTIVTYEYDEDGNRDTVLVQGAWTFIDGLECPILLRIPKSDDALDAPLDRGETVTIHNVFRDARVSDSLRELQRASGRHSLAMIPLMTRGVRIGLVVLSNNLVNDWRDEELHTYQITAAQLAAAIDHRQQQAVIIRRDQQLAVLEERRRLARELHDSVTQHIFSSTLIAQSIGSAWKRSPQEGEQRVKRLLELSQAALAEMRALLVELQPPEQPTQMPAPTPAVLQVQKGGLVMALEQHLESLRKDGLQAHLTVDGYQALPSQSEQHLFRITQEALNNVVKHAKATDVTVYLCTQAGATSLTIRDNGIGFQLPNPQQTFSNSASTTRQGFGMQSMRERVESLQGEIEIQSAPHQGTTVCIRLPVSCQSSNYP